VQALHVTTHASDGESAWDEKKAALHVTTHASDGESAWDEKKGSHSASGHILHVGRPDASYTVSQKMSEVKWISSCMESNT
jgi:hypothetical protein